MTTIDLTTETPVVRVRPGGEELPPRTAVSAADEPPAPRKPSARGHLVAVSLTLLGGLLCGFAAELVVLGTLRHRHDQAVGYAALRESLATAVAPVSGVRADGRALPLGTPLAVIEVPRIGLREVVREGTTSGVLRSGPGHERDTVLPGQLGLSEVFGRRLGYGGPFHAVPSLRVGDQIITTTGQGVAHYRVRAVRHGSRTHALVPAGTAVLTLTTSDGPKVLPSGITRVDAVLVGTPFQVPTARIRSSSMSDAERPLAGDPSALVPVLLVGELLLMAGLGLTWARISWGPRQAWVIGVPVLLAVGVAAADQASRLLPNLL